MTTAPSCTHHWLCSAPHDGVVHTHCQKCHAERDLPAYEDTTISGQGKGDREVDTTIRYPEKEEVMLSYKRQRFMELEAQKKQIIDTWEKCDRKTTAAARVLKMPASTLYAKLNQWELLPAPPTRRPRTPKKPVAGFLLGRGLEPTDPGTDELTIIIKCVAARNIEVSFKPIDALRQVAVTLKNERSNNAD